VTHHLADLLGDVDRLALPLGVDLEDHALFLPSA
jgi:hypothetical protein